MYHAAWFIPVLSEILLYTNKHTNFNFLLTNSLALNWLISGLKVTQNGLKWTKMEPKLPVFKRLKSQYAREETWETDSILSRDKCEFKEVRVP